MHRDNQFNVAFPKIRMKPVTASKSQDYYVWVHMSHVNFLRPIRLL